MIEAIIFDFDGVILESADIKTNAFRTLFENESPGHINKIVEYHFKNMGISRFVKFKYFYEEILKQPYTEEIENKLGDKFSRIVMNEILNAPFVKGSDDFIKKNYNRYKMFIASGSEENELIHIMKKREIADYFKEIHGGHRSKKNIIEEILLRYELTKNQISFIGDAESDLKAAESLELPFFVARIDGPDSLLKHCKYKINDVTELEDTIKNF